MSRPAEVAERTRWLRIGCAFDYRAEIDTPTVFQGQPNGDGVRLTTERWLIQPDVPIRHYRPVAPGYRRVQQICSHVHDHLTFRYGSSTTMSTATDVNASGLGVCRDFTTWRSPSAVR